VTEPKPPPADKSWLRTREARDTRTYGWVRRTQADEPKHNCEPPMRELVLTIPASGWLLGNAAGFEQVPFGDTPDGAAGDLWRCDCGKLWRITAKCGNCPIGGYHGCGPTWRPATMWQRLRHRRR
jgi:hypothetical protein